MSIVCDIYRGRRHADTYLYVAQDTALDALPAELVQGLGGVDAVMTLTLDASRRLARADVTVVMQALASTGFYLQLPPVGELHPVMRSGGI